MATFISLPTSACSLLRNKKTPGPRFACKANNGHDDADHQQYHNIDRRNILIGLAGAATSLTQDQARAQPIIFPDISTCHTATNPKTGMRLECCPVPNDRPIVDFKRPSRREPLKVRPAAHSVTREYLDKYKKAVELMKALPSDDPRNFIQQANVHCAYCAGAYSLSGHPDLPISVHHSWLFLPWHRCYLYFHERILGKLLGDETFALPFWNWDAPAGMMIPSIYTTDPCSSLYDSFRDARHLPPTVVDLNYNKDEEDTTMPTAQLIDANLKVMCRQVGAVKCPKLFMGMPYRAAPHPDGKTPGSGSLENIPHNHVHTWVGDRTAPDRRDMGVLYAAGRDPLFYAHHANVDRLWSVWKKQGGRCRDLDDRDFLEASFLFYDENKQLVRIEVKDCLVTENLRYKYQDVPNPWLSYPPTPSTTSRKKFNLKSKKAETYPVDFPVTLNLSPVTTIVQRPKTSRSKGEKDEEEEVLVVDDIECERDAYVKFDVYINTVEHEKIGPESSEFAGSFVHMTHVHGNKMEMNVMKTQLNLGINDLLDDIEAEDDESFLVTLVPRSGEAKIGGLKIEFL